MEAKTLKLITTELNTYASMVREEEIAAMVRVCAEAKRIFVAGAGRSGFAARGFANRLMHLGKTVYVVGDTTTPAIGPDDLLVIGSGSGTTASLAVNAERAKAKGASIATITMCPDAAIGRLADVVVTVPGVTWKADSTANAVSTVQPGGNLFEQLSWLIYDSIIMDMMPVLGEDGDTMSKRHANLE